MQKKLLGPILIGIGIALLLVSLLADLLGIGGGYPGIGYKQAIGIVIGICMIIVGLIITRK